MALWPGSDRDLAVGTDPLSPVDVVDSTLDAPRDLDERLLSLWERTGDESFRRLGRGEAPGGEGGALTEQERADWISTRLMHCYKETGDPQVFALLYELNRGPFLQAVQAQVRRSGAPIDPQDVLQEIFLNIYRYPHRFVAEKADSFRNWGFRIVRNTLLKFLKGQSKQARMGSLDDENVRPAEDPRVRDPRRSAEEAETAVIVDRAYLIYLNLYLMHFRRLSAKEQRALTMVEVEGATYKQAAAELGIRLENLKMVIFRGRRKIFRGMSRTLQDLDALAASTPARDSLSP